MTEPVGPSGSSEPMGRSRRLVRGIATAALARGVGLLSPLLLLSLASRTIGLELYGLWVATLSLTGMVAFADLGLGNGLMTRLAESEARGDSRTGRLQVAAAYRALTLIAATLLVLLWIVVQSGFSLAAILDTRSEVLRGDADAIVGIVVASFIVGIPTMLIQRVQYGCQQVARANLWLAAGSLLAVGSFAVATLLTDDPVVPILASAGTPILVSLVNTVLFFTHNRPDLLPLRVSTDWVIARRLVTLGGYFFALSILTAISLNVDTPLVSRSLGLGDAAEYAVAARMAAALGVVVTVVNMPLWAANSQALMVGDAAWIRRTTLRATLLSVSAVLALSLPLAAFGQQISEVLGYPGGVSRGLLLGLAGFQICLAVASPTFMVANAAGIVWPQLVGFGLFLGVGLPLKLILLGKMGAVGLPVAGSAAYAAFLFPMAALGYRSAMRRTRGNETQVRAA